jgi:hypothetical protein
MKPQVAGSVAFDTESFLVDGAMMTPAEQHQIGKRRGTAIGPVHDVMRVAVAQLAARKPAPAVTMLECTPDRRRHRATPAADVQRAAILIVRHDAAAGIACQTARRFRGKKRPGNAGRRGGLECRLKL